MEPSNEQKTSSLMLILIVGVTLIIGVILGIFAFSYFLGVGQEEQGISEADDQVLQPRSVLENRVGELREEVETSSSLAEEAYFNRALAVLNMRLDTAGSNALLREVVVNSEYPSYERGLAAQLIPDIYLTRTVQTPAYAMRYMFVAEPYLSMIATGENDLQRTWNGIRRAYEYTVSLHPLPIAEYRLAEWYIQSTINLSQQTEEGTARAIEHFEKGNELLDSFIQELEFEDSHMELQAYWLKGLVAGNIYALNSEEKYRDAAMEAFERVHALVGSGEVFNNGSSAEVLWNNLYHALFLASLNDATYNERIAELLSEIIANEDTSLGFFRRLEFWAEERPMLQHQRNEKENILALASYNEGFAQLLRTYGLE